MSKVSNKPKSAYRAVLYLENLEGEPSVVYVGNFNSAKTAKAQGTIHANQIERTYGNRVNSTPFMAEWRATTYVVKRRTVEEATQWSVI